MIRLHRRAAIASGIGLCFSLAGTRAQQRWPERPVRLFNSGAPGSGIDVVARLLSQGLAQRHGQPFPVENRPGAGSVLAGQAHAQARPGESLVLAASGIASTVPYTFAGRLPYDAEADLVPIAIPANEFLCWAVPAELPVHTLAELVAYAAARPGQLNWNAVAGFAEFDTRLFLHDRGLEMSFVAYPGSPPAILDLAAGRVQLGVQPLTPLMGAIREGTIRPLAVTASARAFPMPDLPTAEEAGFPDLRYDPFMGLFGWRGLPAELRDSIAASVRDIMAEPANAARLRQAGIQPQYRPPGELAAVIAQQRSEVQRAIQLIGPRNQG